MFKSQSSSPSRFAFLVLLLLSCLGMAAGPPQLTDQDQPLTAVGGQEVQRLAPLVPPPLTARAWILMDATSGAVVEEHNASQQLANASTTKILTALLALELGKLDSNVVATPEAIAEGGSSMGLIVGEVIPLRQMLYGLLLPSGNDAAVAIAQHIAGTTQHFVDLMNARVQALGLHHTHFLNPDGLEIEGHYSSAYDMAVIARTALAIPTFAQVVETRHYAIPASQHNYPHDLTSLNQLLGVYPGADGVKTGTTPLAGECLVASVTRNGRRIISVVLGSTTRYTDTERLFDYFFANYGWYTLSLAGDGAAYLEISATQRYQLNTASNPVLLLPNWEVPQAFLVISLMPTGPLLNQAIQLGKPIGQVTVQVGEDPRQALPLTAQRK